MPVHAPAAGASDLTVMRTERSRRGVSSEPITAFGYCFAIRSTSGRVDGRVRIHRRCSNAVRWLGVLASPIALLVGRTIRLADQGGGTRLSARKPGSRPRAAAASPRCTGSPVLGMGQTDLSVLLFHQTVTQPPAGASPLRSRPENVDGRTPCRWRGVRLTGPRPLRNRKRLRAADPPTGRPRRSVSSATRVTTPRS